MSDRLVVDSGETYTIPEGVTEEWAGTDVDGTLEVKGTLKLIDNPDTPDHHLNNAEPALDLPLGPLKITQMNLGFSVFLVGMLGTLLAAASMLKNYVAIVLLFFGVIALLSSGLFGIGLETFWAFVVATCVALIAGGVVRWIQ